MLNIYLFAVGTIIGTTMGLQITATTMVATITIIIEATFILEPIIIVLDQAMAVKIMDTMVVASSITNTGHLEACLEEAKNLLPLEPEQAFWVGQWQV